MKKYKIFIVSLTSIFLSLSAIADNSKSAGANVLTPATEVSFNNSLEKADLLYAFGTTQGLQIVAMTKQEMDETQGARLSFVIGAASVGALVGTIDYHNSVPESQRTWQGYALAGGSGALGGAIGAAQPFLGGFRAPLLGFVIGKVGVGITAANSRKQNPLD